MIKKSMKTVKDLVRKNISNLKAYSSARDEFDGQGDDYVFLDANENPYPVLEEVSLNSLKLNRYPDPYQNELKQKIAKMQGIDTTYIFMSAGLDQAIEHLIRGFCNPNKDSVLICPPTFGMYAVASEINEVGVKKVPLLAENFDLDVDGILKAVDENTKIVFICNPNNPTGNTFEKEKILKVVRELEGESLVVVDEAYIDFCSEESLFEEVKNYSNLLVMQTFSKAWGLTSARLGRTFCNPEIVEVLNKIKDPYNIPSLTIQVGLMVLDEEQKKNQIALKLIEGREWLVEELNKLDFVKKVYPSKANFILVKVSDANKVYDFLIKNKVVIRNRTTQLNCEGCLRITVGTEEENHALLNALKKFKKT